MLNQLEWTLEALASRRWSLTLIAAAALFGLPSPLGMSRLAHAELAAVWAVDDGTKVSADPTVHPLSQGNGIFRPAPPAVSLFALRNETVAFQVILVGGRTDTAQVRVRLDNVGPIRNSGDSAETNSHASDRAGDRASDRANHRAGGQDSGDAGFTWVGRNIELFEEHYLRIAERSRELVWLAGSDAEPAGQDGLVPDALVPHRSPLTVAAGRSQGLWIDIYVPRDALPGVHRGNLLVEVDGVPCPLAACQLPVELELGRATLPERPTARTMLYFSGDDLHRGAMLSRYLADPRQASPGELEELRRRHFQLARRHRITLFGGGHERQPTDELRHLLGGQAFTGEAGYAGSGEGLGQDLYSIHSYGGTLSPGEAASWSNWFAQHAPGVEHFLYVADEPRPGDFARVTAAAVQARPLPSLVTGPARPGLRLDIHCALPDAYSAAAPPRPAAGRDGAGPRLWIYNGIRPFSGTFVLDDVAISPRVNPWIQYKHRIPRWFYWESTYYVDYQGGRGALDVFGQANTYRNRHGDCLNGDGVLIYPGRDRIFPDQDRHLDSPLPSIRLKNWRRGIEDVEYLELARQAGMGALVESLLATLVPRALAGETRASDPVSWPEDGEPWLEARRVLFQALQSGRAPTVLPPGLARPRESVGADLRRTARAWLEPLLRSKGRRAAASLALGGLLVLAALGVWRARRSRRY